MIEGWGPQLALAVLIAACWYCFAMVLTTPWRKTPVGKWLAAFTVSEATWWSLVGAGTWFFPGYPTALQAVQGLVFFALPVIAVWCAVLMTVARRRALTTANKEG